MRDSDRDNVVFGSTSLPPLWPHLVPYFKLTLIVVAFRSLT